MDDILEVSTPFMQIFYNVRKKTKACIRKGQQSYPSGTQDIFSTLDGDPTDGDMRFFPLGDDIFKTSLIWSSCRMRGGRPSETRSASSRETQWAAASRGAAEAVGE